MKSLRDFEKMLADGKIDSREIDALDESLYADREIDRAEAEILVALYRRVERVTPGFERFFYLALKRHILKDGVIETEETAWLRTVISADGRLTEREKKLIREMRGEAAFACPEFEALYEDCIQ